MRKVLIVRGSREYMDLFMNNGWEVTSSIHDADLVQFTGGEDVSPELYGEAKHPRTFRNYDRDIRELGLFHECLARGIPMAGICRGGQFLNVACGGRMYQHVDNHTGGHMAFRVDTGEQIEVTSTHHQMMRPSDKAEIIMVAHESKRVENMNAGDVVVRQVDQFFSDVEACFYPEQRAFCFQPHPEFRGCDELGRLYLELVDSCLFPPDV